MRKHTSIITGILLLFAVTVSNAQNNAHQQIQSLVKNLRDHKNIEMTFNYQYVIPTESNAEVKEGKAYLQGEAYKIIMDEQHTISDGKTIWTYLADDEEVMVSNASDGTDNTPLKLLTTLDKDYKATAINKDKIELNNPKGDFKKIVVTVESKNNTLKSAEIFADDGSKMVITFLDMKFDQTWKDGFFTFDEKAYPEAEIIDMR